MFYTLCLLVIKIYKMAITLDELMKEDINFLTTKLEKAEVEINQQVDDLFQVIDNYLKRSSSISSKNEKGVKENRAPVTNAVPKGGRRKKNVLADITEDSERLECVRIKEETLSIGASSESALSVISDTFVKAPEVEVKKEKRDMPAPNKPPPRKKKIKAEPVEILKRSTRTRTKTRRYHESSESSDDKSSDVIIQNTTITTVDITDSFMETQNRNETQKVKKATVSKTRKPKKKAASADEINENINDQKITQENEAGPSKSNSTTKPDKRNRSDSADKETCQTKTKKSKSNSLSEPESDKTAQTEYEDAVSTVDRNENQKNPDSTYISDPKACTMNCTVVLEHPKILTNSSDQTAHSAEKQAAAQEKQVATNEKLDVPQKKAAATSEIERVETKTRTPPKPKSRKPNNKEIFSPYDKTPVKHKVEAFEKLGVGSSSIPTRVTRSKKRTEVKDKADKEREISNDEPRPKTFTPFTSKFTPNKCSTAFKRSRLLPGKHDSSTCNDSVLSHKSLSALKASQVEFREREKRRQEKEREALKKREALLMAQTEEKRKRREEKQLKAQQQREHLEKEKQKFVEQQKIKEEKLKQALAERDEKLQKQREETERKRMLAKKKANELYKEKEEAIRDDKITVPAVDLKNMAEMAKEAQKQRMQQQQQHPNLPIYMTTRAPLLPTDDCYDSDDPNFERQERICPSWSKERQLKHIQRVMNIAGEKLKNTFFSRKLHTPDLIEIFEYVDPRKLKRTSSARWEKPPRYTLLSVTNTTHISEDSELDD